MVYTVRFNGREILDVQEFETIAEFKKFAGDLCGKTFKTFDDASAALAEDFGGSTFNVYGTKKQAREFMVEFYENNPDEEHEFTIYASSDRESDWFKLCSFNSIKDVKEQLNDYVNDDKKEGAHVEYEVNDLNENIIIKFKD